VTHPDESDVSSSQTPVFEELLELMKGGGLTSDRAIKMPHLMQALERRRTREGLDQDADHGDAAVTLILKKLGELPSDLRSVAEYAFGSEDRRGVLRTRQEAWSSAQPKEAPRRSKSSFNRERERAAREVARRIEGTTAPEGLKEATRAHRYIIDRMSSSYVLGADRSVDYLVATMDFTVTIGGQLSTLVSYEYRGESGPDVLSFEPLWGCELIGPSSFEDGYHFQALRLGEPLAQGAKHHVAYLVRVHSNAPCVPSLFVTGTSGAGEQTVRAQFHPDATPTQAWRFERLSAFNFRRRSERRQIPFDQESLRYISATWSMFEANFVWGLEWTWGDESG